MSGHDITPWGRAIAELLKEAKCSRRKAAQHRLAPYSAFSQCKTSRQGPSVAVLDRLLRGLGLTWEDWARVFQPLSATSQNRPRADEHKRGGKRTPAPVPPAGLRLVK